MTAHKKTVLKRQTVTDSVAEYIAGKIISGEYPGGHQIRQEAVAAELGVSRIPVREALLQLDAEGLVVNRRHRGAIVSELSIEDAEDLFDARLLLEPFLVRKAMARMVESDIEEARQGMTAYERGIASHLEPSELSRLNWNFHLAMIAPSGRSRSISVIRTLYNSADRYVRRQIAPQAAQERAMANHRVIFDAFARRDVETTVALVTEHIVDASSEIIEALRGKLAPSSRVA